ncbi:MAG: DUF4258 domain-containing protein [Ardenticatenales bacterium]|nr:DUF4258 domain-containing protein [Ardenticatenales bacterium]
MNDPCPSLDHYTVTDHARDQLARRGLSEADLQQALAGHVRSEPVRTGRCVYQLMFTNVSGTAGLLRVFVDVDREPPEVVTVYFTSKLTKYWR